MTVRIVKVIYCDEGRKGRGTLNDVMRPIPSLYTLDGRLICEFDTGPGDTPEGGMATVNVNALQTLRMDQT